MTGRSFRGLLWALALFGASTDLTSKYMVFRGLEVNPATNRGEHQVFPGWFMLTTQFTGKPIESGNWRAPLQSFNGASLPHVNDGALFGIGQRYTGTANQFFAAVSLVAALAILTWSVRTRSATDGVLCAALGLILGGTIGNLYDRLVFHGVRDFLYFYKIEWPVFNVADCCLVAGAGLLLIQALWPAPKEQHLRLWVVDGGFVTGGGRTVNERALPASGADGGE